MIVFHRGTLAKVTRERLGVSVRFWGLGLPDGEPGMFTLMYLAIARRARRVGS